MILYLCLRLAVLVFGYLPFCVLYRIADVLVMVFYYLGIRRRTIEENLADAFPHKSSKQLHQLAKSVYKNFFDVMFVEMIKSFTISSKQLASRFDAGDLALAELYLAQKKSLVIVLGHYANWEWGVSVAHAFNCVAFYKPIKNKYIDRYIRRNRARHHFELASINRPLPTFLKYRDRETAYFLIADKQNVKKRHAKRVIWLPFLSHEAPFLLGPATYAQKFNYPVLYSQIKRVGRGRYQHQLIPVVDDVQQHSVEAITAKWVNLLEQQVLEDPGCWLWFWATTRSRQQKIKPHEELS